MPFSTPQQATSAAEGLRAAGHLSHLGHRFRSAFFFETLGFHHWDFTMKFTRKKNRLMLIESDEDHPLFMISARKLGDVT